VLGFAPAFNIFYSFLHLLLCVSLVFEPDCFGICFIVHCLVREGLEGDTALEGKGASKCVRSCTELTLGSQLSNSVSHARIYYE
jgi:hypothetical protein